MTDTTSNATADTTESLRGVILSRLMLLGNSMPIEALLPEAYLLLGPLPNDTRTRLMMLDSMHGQAIESLNNVEAALLTGDQRMFAIAAEIMDQTEDLITTMIHVLLPPDTPEEVNFLAIWEEFLSDIRELDLDKGKEATSLVSARYCSLMLIQQLAWCLDVVFLAHHKLADEEYDAIAEHGDEEDSWSSVLSYEGLPVLHQGAHGIMIALINLKKSLASTKHQKQSHLVREITKSVDLLVNRFEELPVFILPSAEGGFSFYGSGPWSTEGESKPDWLENHITSCVDMIFKLDKLKASGRTPKKAETRLDAVVTSLQTWVAAAEKHQASDKAGS